MTEEDKQLIAEYMGWELSVYSREYYYIPKNGKVVYFDLTDVGLCVQEMQKRGGDYWHFYLVAEDLYRADEEGAYIHCNETEPCAISRWLFNTDNFFTAMSQWIKEGKK